jgi:predicted transcriptional regulator
MNHYIDEFLSSQLPEYKGYVYARTELLFIPIYRVNLTVVKRKYVSLSLIEEIILRIIECGLTDIDEIMFSLGLEREIITLILAELHSKDLAYSSANNCIISGKGREALRTLGSIKREIDVLRNLYVNTGNDTISLEASKFIQDRYTTSDHMIDMRKKIDKVEYYTSLMNEIRDIFSQTNLSQELSDKNIEEILSIEEVDIRQIHYMRIPVHIYVSEALKEYDIIPKETVHRSVLKCIKSLIFSLVKQDRILKDVFIKDVMCDYQIQNISFISPRDFSDALTELLSNKEDNILAIEKLVLSNRRLLQYEFTPLYNLLLSRSKRIVIYAKDSAHLERNSQFLSIIDAIPTFISLSIVCESNNTVNFSEVIKKHCPNAEILTSTHHEWISIIFDEHFQLTLIPKTVYVEDVGKQIVTIDYYFTDNAASIILPA